MSVGDGGATRASRRSPASTLLRTVSVAVLLAVILLNLLTVRSADQALPAGHRALMRHSDGSLLAIAREHDANVASTFVLGAWLADNARGADLVVTSGHPLALEILVGLGRVEVRYGDYQARLDAQQAADLSLRADLMAAYFIGPHEDRIGSESATGRPPAFERGDVAILTDAEGLAEHPQFITYWGADIVLLVDELVAERHGLEVPPE